MRKERGIDQGDRRALPLIARVRTHAEGRGDRSESGFGIQRPDALYPTFEGAPSLDENTRQQRLLDAGWASAVSLAPPRMLLHESIDDAWIEPTGFVEDRTWRLSRLDEAESVTVRITDESTGAELELRFQTGSGSG